MDTPGFGESADLNQKLMDFLPHAVSFVFIVNASNAGGIHEGGVSNIILYLVCQKINNEFWLIRHSL